MSSSLLGNRAVQTLSIITIITIIIIIITITINYLQYEDHSHSGTSLSGHKQRAKVRSKGNNSLLVPFI